MMSASATWKRTGWRRALAVFLLGVAAASSVILTTINSFVEEREFPHIPFSNVLGPAKLSELRFEYAARGGTVSASMVQRGKKAALTSPLSTEPLLFAALLQFPTKDSLGTVDAEPFLHEVLRRDPRSRAAHILLLRRAIAGQELETALFHLSRLKQLEPEMIGQLMRAVGAQITSIRAADEFAEALTDHIELVDGISEGVAGGQASPNVIARFASKLPRAAVAQGAATPALIDRLIKEGYILEARNLWAEVNELSPSEHSEPVYDPKFVDKVARAPFGWTYIENETGVSEWRKRGSVYIEYYGRRSGTLLSQTLALMPGQYRAIAVASHQMPNQMPKADPLALQVACVGGAPLLAQSEMRPKAAPNIASEIEFQVPPSCAGQVIAIVGLPREGREGGAILLHELSIERMAIAK